MIDVYRIEAWAGPRPRRLLMFLRILVTGRQPTPPAEPSPDSARRIRRGMVRALASELGRPWRVRRRWQAEARYHSLNARRGWTKAAAVWRMERDLVMATLDEAFGPARRSPGGDSDD